MKHPKHVQGLVERCGIDAHLGEGGFAKVQEVTYKPDGKAYALKTFKFVKPGHQILGESEALYHSMMDHENIVKVKAYDIDYEGQQSHLLLELCEGESLASILREHDVAETLMSTDKVWSYCVQILQGLHYMHDSSIRSRDTAHHGAFIHGDLKPGNIFLAEVEQFTIKIGDLGLVAPLGDGKTVKFSGGTWAYMAPEAFLRKEYNDRADVWSLGIILLEMLQAFRPFHRESYEELLKIHQNGTLMEDPDSDQDPELAALIKRMLQRDPAQRPSVATLLEDTAVMDHLSRYKRERDTRARLAAEREQRLRRQQEQHEREVQAEVRAEQARRLAQQALESPRAFPAYNPASRPIYQPTYKPGAFSWNNPFQPVESHRYQPYPRREGKQRVDDR